MPTKRSYSTSEKRVEKLLVLAEMDVAKPNVFNSGL